jgi:hypothetical protein
LSIFSAVAVKDESLYFILVLLPEQIKDGNEYTEGLRQLLDWAVEGVLPDLETIRLAIKLTAATASGSFTYFSAEQHQANREPGEDDIMGMKGSLLNTIILKTFTHAKSYLSISSV